MSPRPPLTVLLVEDHPLNMALATELLASAGIEVLQAEEAERGLELAGTEAPDLILMDIQLPGMDGITAIERLRGSEATSSIPVVVLSAHAMKADADRARGAGADGYIAKPIDTRTFVETVLSYVSDRQQSPDE